MNTLHITPNFNASRMNFDEVLETASNHIKSLPDAIQRSLKEDLENGLANLSSSNQLQKILNVEILTSV